MPTYTRTRTGCFTCREDGYKCDEQKPHCGRCLRLAKTCKGYGVRLKWHTPATPANAAGTRGARRDKLTKSAASQAGRGSTGRQSSALSSHSPASFLSCSSSPPLPSSSSPDQSQYHSPTGCPAPPVPNTVPSGGGAVQSALTTVTPSYLPPDLEPSTRLLLHHWTRNLATVLSVAAGGSERNPFLVHLTPMLLHSEALRAVVCSMAACHLAVLRSYGGGGPPDTETGRLFRTMAWRQRLLAASQLRREVAHDASEPSLAAILMLQVSDRLFTTSDAKIDHLAGARAVVMKHGAGGSGGLADWTRSSTSAQFLLSLCYYHDVLSSVSRGTSPLFEFDDSLPIEGLETMRTLTQVLRLVAQISAMRGLPAEARARRGEEIEEELKRTGEGENEHDETEDANGDAAIHTTLAYKHAAFIYLERVWHHSAGALPSPPTIASTPDTPTPFVSHAKHCLHHLARVPSSSPLLSAHMWPLWTAGCETIDAAGRGFVLGRLDAMFAARHFPSLLRAKRDIQDVWLAKDAQREQVGVDNVDCIKLILQQRQREADLA